jgi:hypothetical protein
LIFVDDDNEGQEKRISGEGLKTGIACKFVFEICGVDRLVGFIGAGEPAIDELFDVFGAKI